MLGHIVVLEHKSLIIPDFKYTMKLQVHDYENLNSWTMHYVLAQIKILSPTFATTVVLKIYLSFIGVWPSEIRKGQR